MYVLIDKNQLAIVHKHDNPVALRLLGWIECANYFAIVGVKDTRALSAEFSFVAMAKIYENATGGKLNPYSGFLPSAILKAAQRMKDTDLSMPDLERQAAMVRDGSALTFRYRKGAEQPDQHKKGYVCPPIKVERVVTDESISFVPTVTKEQQLEEAKARGDFTPTQTFVKPVFVPRPAAPVLAPAPAGYIKRPWEK
jgi:hypothetical protein